MWKEKINVCTLSGDLHTCAMEMAPHPIKKKTIILETLKKMWKGLSLSGRGKNEELWLLQVPLQKHSRNVFYWCGLRDLRVYVANDCGEGDKM